MQSSSFKDDDVDVSQNTSSVRRSWCEAATSGKCGVSVIYKL
jgi:hypothetical protein